MTAEGECGIIGDKGKLFSTLTCETEEDMSKTWKDMPSRGPRVKRRKGRTSSAPMAELLAMIHEDNPLYEEQVENVRRQTWERIERKRAEARARGGSLQEDVPRRYREVLVELETFNEPEEDGSRDMRDLDIE